MRGRLVANEKSQLLQQIQLLLRFPAEIPFTVVAYIAWPVAASVALDRGWKARTTVTAFRDEMMLLRVFGSQEQQKQIYVTSDNVYSVQSSHQPRITFKVSAETIDLALVARLPEAGG
jgi:hypothetical protein